MDSAGANFPEEIKHPSHPFHPLKRSSKGSECELQCSDCSKPVTGTLYYYCERCNFNLDSDCAFLVPTMDSCGHEKLAYDGHGEHPLVLCQTKEDDKLECKACEKQCLGLTFACHECRFFLHRSCAKLPRTIHHPSHPVHPLERYWSTDKFKCHDCLKDHEQNTISYYCNHCEFYLDFECAFLKPFEFYEGQEIVLKSFHEHPLSVVDRKEEGDAIKCIACCELCSGQICTCHACHIFLHISCAGLPNTLQHPLHQTHSLHLRKDVADFTCSVCLKAYRGLYFNCSECSTGFMLHAGCLSVKYANIIYQGHEHPLLFLENVDDTPLVCEACKTPCKSPMFHCVTCKFNLHLLCGPLPCTVKHRRHMHELVLLDSFVEDDFWEYYCDICEKERDPEACIYYCGERNFYAAELKCVMSEVIHLLKGKSGDVKLRALGRWKPIGKALSTGLSLEEYERRKAMEYKSFTSAKEEIKPVWSSVKEIVESLSGEEKADLENIFNRREKLFGHWDGEVEKTADDWPYTDVTFLQFVQNLDSEQPNEKELKKVWEVDRRFIQVREHAVAEELVPVYNDLFLKYGDVSAESKLSGGMKAIFFLYLCLAMEKICTTFVGRVTKEELVRWWCYIKAVHNAGFKVQFVVDYLERVVHAYFGLRDMEHEQKVLEDLGEKEKECEKTIEEEKKMLEEVNVKRKQHLDLINSKHSDLIEKCIEEGLRLQYETAGDILLSKD